MTKRKKPAPKSTEREILLTRITSLEQLLASGRMHVEDLVSWFEGSNCYPSCVRRAEEWLATTKDRINP